MSNEQRDIVGRINAWIEEIGHPYLPLTTELLRDEVLEEITRLRKIEADAKAANMIGPDGNVRKVLGKLAITADEAIVGDYAPLYDILNDYPLMSFAMVRMENGVVRPDLRHMFSTPASERENKEKA